MKAEHRTSSGLGYHLIKRGDRKGVHYVRYLVPFGGGRIKLGWVSTGQTDRDAAAAWADAHEPPHTFAEIDPGGDIRFREYAKGWFEFPHNWVRSRLAEDHSLSPTYLSNCRTYLARHILPTFGPLRLSEITAQAIRQWMLTLKDKGLSGSSRNHILMAMRDMLKEAVFEELIPQDPSAFVRKHGEHHKARGILSIAEFRLLMDESAIETVWRGSLEHYTVNLLAAWTGMRLGEIQGLQVQHVLFKEGDGSKVEIRHGWRHQFGLSDAPKCNSSRDVPFPDELIPHLRTVILHRGCVDAEDLVFAGDAKQILRRNPSANPRRYPISHGAVERHLYVALERIGIVAKERNIVFHSWRHFYATHVRNSSILKDHQVRALTGHRTAVIERYSDHQSADDLRRVIPALRGMLNPSRS